LRNALPPCDSFSITLSVTAWPLSEVPAARKVTGVRCLAAMGRMRRASASDEILTTMRGLRR